MRLNPKEQEKLMLHMAGNLAKERKERGVKLNYVEAVAYISSELLELARDGKEVVELMLLGTKMLTKDDVMDGVADMVHEVQVEATFPDGTTCNSTQSDSVKEDNYENWRNHSIGQRDYIKRGQTYRHSQSGKHRRPSDPGWLTFPFF